MAQHISDVAYPARVRSYTRRGGRMPSRHQRAVDRHGPAYVLEVPREGDGGSVVAGSRLDLEAAFGRKAPVVLEIGSGAGDCVVAAAQQHPDLDFLAMEVWRPGLAQTISKAVHAGVDNIRLVEADAAQALPVLIGPGSLHEVWTFFPDPWPKKKHHKRRLVTLDFAVVIANVLAAEGIWRLATDWEDYAWQMLAVVQRSPRLRNLHAEGDGFAPRFDGRVMTRFETRGGSGRVGRCGTSSRLLLASNMPSMTSTYALYRRLQDRPLGKQAFGLGFMLKAPYFATVRPQVVTMEPHRGVVRIRKRRAVHNHIGTIHAIAVANGLEAAMGLLCEATTPAGMRWIPKGIQLDYLAKVTTDVQCSAQTDPADWEKEPPFQVDVCCTGMLPDGTEVVKGVIPVWVTAK